MKNNLAVVIGRFQPLHKGHEHLIQQALEVSENVLILVGSANEPRTPKNPWTFEERKKMILSTFSTVTVSPIQDHPYSDTDWVVEVQSVVQDCLKQKEIKGCDVVLVGHHKDDSSYYLNHFPQWKFHETQFLSIYNSKCMDATRVRELMFERDLIFVKGVVNDSVFNIMHAFTESEDYSNLLEDYKHIKEYKKAWAAAPYPPTFLTVDSVVVQSGHVLMVRRGCSPGLGLWALPGGFLNQNETMLDGAIRELYEETSIKVQEKIIRRCVDSSKVFDAPGRSLRGRTVTQAFLIKLDDNEGLPKIKAADDAALAWWISISEIKNMRDQIFEDHAHIIDEMLKLVK